MRSLRHDHYDARVPPRRQTPETPPGIVPVLAIDRASEKPLYRQLYDGYREAIVERRLRTPALIARVSEISAENEAPKATI